MTEKSPKKASTSRLGSISEPRIMAFLTDCVNLPNPIDYPNNRPHFERWLNRWQRMFTYLPNGESVEHAPVPREQLEIFAPAVRTILHRLWFERGTRQYDWYCYRLRDAHRQMIRHLEGWDEVPLWSGGKHDTTASITAPSVTRLTDYALTEVPEDSPFERAIQWLFEHRDQRLYCAAPDCETPYDFRVDAPRQKFCSDVCANTARKAAKLDWWHNSPNSPKNRNLK